MWRFIKLALLVLSLLFAGKAVGNVRVEINPTIQVVVNGRGVLQIGKAETLPKPSVRKDKQRK